MKEIAVISGKGGTGKTIITASLAVIAERKVMADCDVDASNLHLLLHPEIKEKHEFIGGKEAKVIPEKCIGCAKCEEVCRFDAVYRTEDLYAIDGFSCEGCGACKIVCPTDAIEMEAGGEGEYFISQTEYGSLVHAQLGIAQENSGKLVSIVKEKAREIALRNSDEYILIDGPPGIGCPVISTLSGCNTALIITEPSLSAIHDMERAIEISFHFGVRVFVCINKFDLNYENTQRIEKYANSKGVEVIAKIPFQEKIIESVRKGIPPIKFVGGEFLNSITKIWEKIKEA